MILNNKVMKRSIFRSLFLQAGIFLLLMANSMQGQDLNSAILLMRSEKYDEAETLLNQLIEKEPANSKNYFYLGENHLLDYFADTISKSLTISANEAKEVFQKGVEANPSDPLNYVGLAKVAYYLGDDKTAEEMREKAKSFLLPYKNLRRIQPPAQEYAFALAKIAESYIKNGNVDTSKALPLIRQALTIDSKNKDIYLIAGDIYIFVNDGSNAIMNYNQAQYYDPESPTANMKIGSIYVKGRILQTAIPYFEEAIKLNPEYAPAYRELGELYWKAGRLEQSKENYRKYLELTAGNIPAKIRYVNSLFYANDYDEVIRNVEEILSIDQSYSYMNRLAGYSCYEKKDADYDKALAYMETLFETVAPERILKKDYNYLARILLKKHQDYPQMVDELNRLKPQLERARTRFTAAGSSSEKASIKATIDELATKINDLENNIKEADPEIERAFDAYDKLLTFNPEDRAVLSEIATNYYNYKRYEGAAETWIKMLSLGRDSDEDYMQIGRAYYTAERYNTADSIFNIIINRSPDYIPAYVMIARTYSRMDPDSKRGLARPKFEMVVEKAKADSIKYADQMMEAFNYLGYYHMTKNNFNKSKEYYNRMINLDPTNNENKIRGYLGIGSVETEIARNEQTLEGKLAILNRAISAYNRILSLDPANASAKSTVRYLQSYQASVRKGINPNEIKGVIRDAATRQPIPYASVRVKDTAAENLANSKGEYKFEIPQGSEILIISAKGYVTKEIPITKSRTYNVSLEK
jgi:tetratricopeptide (TPR) repeat protein